MVRVSSASILHADLNQFTISKPNCWMPDLPLYKPVEMSPMAENTSPHLIGVVIEPMQRVAKVARFLALVLHKAGASGTVMMAMTSHWSHPSAHHQSQEAAKGFASAFLELPSSSSEHARGSDTGNQNLGTGPKTRRPLGEGDRGDGQVQKRAGGSQRHSQQQHHKLRDGQ